MAVAGAELGDGTMIKIHPSAWLIVATLALLLGQALAVLPWEIPTSTALVGLAPLMFCFSSRWRGLALLVFLAATALSIGYLRHRQLLYPSLAENHLRAALVRDPALYLEGVFAAEPERLVQRYRWRLRAETIWHDAGGEEVSGDILVSLRTMTRDWRYGDRVRLRLRGQVPQDSGNPGGFNYATYLAHRGIYAVAFLDNDQQVELLARTAGGAREFVEALRRQIRVYIERALTPDNGALMKALVVGDMGRVSKEMRSAFTAAGVNHVLSISGLHVAMLGLVVFVLIRHGLSFNSYLLLRLNLLKVATFGSFLAVLFYTALAGAMVPTVRSAIMIGVYELAVLLDREEEVFTSLTLAALLIALVWPGVVADISFQLSFLAVLFIVWGSRRLHERLRRQHSDDLPQEKSWWREKLRQAAMHLAVPLLATLGTGPLIAHYFGHLSLAGFVANPLIVPLVGFLVVPVGLAIGFCAVIAPSLAPPLVWLIERLASLTAWLVELFARLPLANIGVAAPNPLEIFLLYGLIMAAFAVRRRRQLWLLVSVSIVLVGLDSAYWWRERTRQDRLRISHLNVGQGDAAVVELPGGKVLVIDAGGAASGDFDTGEAIVAPFLRARKITKVDFLMVSHARVDHYGGMAALVIEFAPTEFWSGIAKGKTRRFEDLADELTRGKIPQLTLIAGQPCRVIEGARLCVLHPSADSEDGSVVLRVEFGKASFLFAGDIDKRKEALLARRSGELRSLVVKIPRHGGTTANSQEFIAAVAPKLAVLSAGARSRSESQREEVTERYREAGAQVLSTHEDGAVIVETDGATVRYSGYKSGRTAVLRIE
ncbi:MAG: DNA internalization-related competence protein ComEC/Rec2 [Deltaproteobacteria bacterium]|nr:DNA internalization-related competence protein ComEC/Rec2 [Deltaproteobacteria bacterium]